MTNRILVALMAVVVMGCQTTAIETDHAARITNPDSASRAALQAAVYAALHTNVRISDTALTDGDVLTIEKDPPRTMDNPNPQGRILEMPVRFHLVINGTDCVLVDQRDQARYLLADTSCAPLAEPINTSLLDH